MSIQTAQLALYQELLSGARKRLPNGYWTQLGKTGACALLRWKVNAEGWTEEDLVNEFQRKVLRDWKLVSPASKFFSNVPLDFVRTAYPSLKDRKFRFDRGQVSKRENFFDEIRTEQQAYFLGWMASDGNVTKTNQVSLWVGKKDAWAIDVFAKALKLNPYQRKERRDGTVGVVVCSAMLARGLAARGIFPAKSYTVGWPNGLPNHLEGHFMRGLLDGDGSVGENQWTFATASGALLTAFKERADAIVGIPLNVSKMGPGKRTFLLTGGRNTWSLLDHIYASATLALPRKQQRYLSGKREIPVLEPIRPTARKRSGRRGYSVLVRCSRCGEELRRPESRTVSTKYVFCDSHTASERQRWMNNQGPTVGTSPYDEKLDDDALRKILEDIAATNRGRLPSLHRIGAAYPQHVVRAIRARGGLGEVAEQFSIRTAIRRRGALDELSAVLSELDEIANAVGYFPTAGELLRRGRHDLLNAARKKHGGLTAVREAWEHCLKVGN